MLAARRIAPPAGSTTPGTPITAPSSRIGGQLGGFDQLLPELGGGVEQLERVGARGLDVLTGPDVAVQIADRAA